MHNGIKYIILKTNYYYEKVFEGWIEIPMGNNNIYCSVNNYSNHISDGNN